MQKNTTIRLTSSEIAVLWTAYTSDSMAKCVLDYFINKVQDNKIKPILEYARSLSEQHIIDITNFFNQDGLPIPHGFTGDDVDVTAPPLYSDSFYLFYLTNMTKIGSAGYALALNTTARADIRQYFTECSRSTNELLNKVADLMLSKGLYVRSPFIEVPKTVEFVKKQNFMEGLFGNTRPLVAMEISHLYSNIQTNIMGGALVTGFGQVAKSKEVREYMLRGIDITTKQSKILSSLLEKDNLPIPSTPDTFVSDFTIAPFSDKLMMFHAYAITAAGIGNYGVSFAVSLRRDLQVNYTRLMAELALLGEDGVNIMIDNGWMEQQPQAINHKELVGV